MIIRLQGEPYPELNRTYKRFDKGDNDNDSDNHKSLRS